MIIDGSAALRRLTNRLFDSRDVFQDMDILIVFENNPGLSPPASKVSAREKIRTFQILGANVNVLSATDLLNGPLADKTHQYAIFQRPFSASRISEILERVDATNLESVFTDTAWDGFPAVVEAVYRVIHELDDPGSTAVVVGGHGYFGSAVCEAMSRLGIRPHVLDKGDSLIAAREFDIIVSAAGSPNILDSRHIRVGQSIIDIGFAISDESIPQHDGDISCLAYHIPRFITPVPGGVGPLQVASLVERSIYVKTGRNHTRWSLK